MAPLDQFERRMRELINEGCTVDEAFMIATQEFGNLVKEANALLKIKQKVERERKFG